MSLDQDLRVAILDRPQGADSAVLHDLEERVRLQRLLPEDISELHPETEVLLIRGGFWKDFPLLLAIAPALRWIHVNMAGVDHLDTDLLRRRGVQLTNSSGVLDGPIAEYVLSAVLLWSKGLHRTVLDTQQLIWNPREPLLNASLCTLILGAGGIGTACAMLLRSAGFGPITGLRRSESALDRAFDHRIGAEELEERICDFDVIISCLPATPATERLVSGMVLDRLRDEVVFVNVGRGLTVDHDHLAKALAERRNALAVLDVTEPEPLPNGHPLWTLPNVVLSPHMAGETVERHDNFSRLFVDNLERYSEGTPLKNRV